MDIVNLKKALNKAKTDITANISIAFLTGNAEFGLHATEIAPGAKITAHYHQHGMEIYGILSGTGVIYTAKPSDEGYKNLISKPIQAGDFFTIEANTIHQLINTGKEPLLLVFGCPKDHLGADRIVTEDLIRIF